MSPFKSKMFKKVLEKINKWSLGEKILFVFLIFSQVYYSYRYIFRYGSEISSPGYRLTPQIFQITKYPVALIFILFLFVYILKKERVGKIVAFFRQEKSLIVVLIFFLYLSLSLFKYNLSDSFALTQILKMLFVIPFFLLVPFIIKKSNLRDFLYYFFIFSIVFHFLYDIIMIFFYYVFNILPGMDFGDWVGRFGGSWDDPNSFAALLILTFICFAVFTKEPETKKEIIYYSLFLILLSSLLVFTYSLTGLVGLFVSLVLLFLTRTISLKGVAVIIVTLITLVSFSYFSGYFRPIIKDKTGSVSERIETTTEQITVNSEKPLTKNTYIGSFTSPSFNENFYLQYFDNFGLVGSVLFVLSIGIIYIKTLFNNRIWENKFEENTIKVFLVFVPIFLFMNFGIPYLQIFPLNLIFWLIMSVPYLLLYNKKNSNV